MQGRVLFYIGNSIMNPLEEFPTLFYFHQGVYYPRRDLLLVSEYNEQDLRRILQNEIMWLIKKGVNASRLGLLHSE